MTGRIDRRAFLGFAATGAAGLLLPTIARPRAKVFDMGRGSSQIAKPAETDIGSTAHLRIWTGKAPPKLIRAAPPGTLVGVFSLSGMPPWCT